MLLGLWRKYKKGGKKSDFQILLFLSGKKGVSIETELFLPAKFIC